jgi:hypothetical protein
VDAFFFVELEAKKADSIKQAIEGPQRAKNAAEKPADQDGADNDNNHPAKLVDEIEAEVLPQGRFQDQERQRAHESPGRTKEFTKPGLAQTEFIDDKQGHDNHHNDENNIAAIVEHEREFKFARRNLVQKVLNQTEGTEPAAGETAGHDANNTKVTQDDGAKVSRAGLD